MKTIGGADFEFHATGNTLTGTANVGVVDVGMAKSLFLAGLPILCARVVCAPSL
jgi:hypothetical protein